MQTLFLATNKISFIDDFVFSALTNLTKLTLNNTQLIKISENLFYGLFYLIEYIEPYAFKHLNKLQFLYIRNNKLREIDNLTLTGLVKLETLSLSYNYFKSVNKHMFGVFENLKVLYLDWNLISHVDQDAFVFAKNLTELYLSNNLLNLSTDFFEYFISASFFGSNQSM